MTGAINARMLGDEYQAIFFWLKACEMISDYSHVESISFESPELKSIDDVVIHYRKPIRGQQGSLIYKEYYQIKYHVDQRNYFTLDNLMDPKFINASQYSFLQRVKAASEVLNQEGAQGSAIFVSPWVTHPDDAMAKLKLVDNNGGHFKLENLFDGRVRSEASKLRERLKDHLDIQSDNELKQILRPIRICSGYYSMDTLIQMLNGQLKVAGLLPINLTKRSNPYIQLLQRLFREGQIEFNRDSLIKTCKEEELWIGNNIMRAEEVPVGIRSFSRRADNMENDTEQMLCLLDQFNGRYLNDSLDWNQNIHKLVEDYVSQYLEKGTPYCLYLDTHMSIAFTAGYLLDYKSGVSAVPFQKGLNPAIWRVDSNISKERYPMWSVDHEVGSEEGDHIIIVMEMTHSVMDDVGTYIEENNLSVKSIIRFYFEAGTSFNAIEDGTHAWYLANEISKTLNTINKKDRTKHFHFFGSGPNGLWFFLGQFSRSFGNLTLYEFDFEGFKNYYPTITLPSKKEVI